MEELGKVRGIVEKAASIESQATYSYLLGLSRLRFFGHLDPQLEESVRRIAVETIIHKHLMEALLGALSELEKMDQSLTSLEERGVKVEELKGSEKGLLRRFAEMHLEIEKDMIETYRRLAEESEHPLIKKLAEALAENEEQHHAYLARLIESTKE